MPEALEKELISKALAKGYKGKKKDAYVYGTLRKTGWIPGKDGKRSSNG